MYQVGNKSDMTSVYNIGINTEANLKFK